MPCLSITSYLTLALAAAVPVLATDCGFAGGFAVRQSGSCSSDSDAPVQCGGGHEYKCCLKGTFCKMMTGGNTYCCPTDEDCYEDVSNVPKCAKSDWLLSVISNFQVSDAFCCRTGFYGVFVSGWGDGGAVDCTSIGKAIGTDAVTGVAVPSPPLICTTISSGRSPDGKSSGGATPTSGAAQTSDPSGTANQQSNPSSTVGKGAIAGIVVGSVAGVALIAAAAWWIGRHRAANRNYHYQQPCSPAAHNAAYSTAAWADHQQPDAATEGPVHMADEVPVSEMEENSQGTFKVHELPAQPQVPGGR